MEKNMRKRYLKTVFFTAIFYISIIGGSEVYSVYAAEGYNADADPYFQDDMNMYYQYVESHELSDYLDGSKGIFGDASSMELYVQKIKVADFDGDNRAEIWITGPAASASSIAGILDISDDQVRCVFNGWGNEVGRYTEPETGKTGLVIEEGNSDGDGYSHTRISMYDENWDNTTLLESESNETTEETERISTKDNGKYTQIRNGCNEVAAVEEKEADHMGKEDVEEFLGGLSSSISAEEVQTGSITGYPEYDEIISLYHKGEKLHWSMEEFREHNLCYLAGYEMGGEENRTGYYVTDINGDGIDELMVGFQGDGLYVGMFYDLYTMIDDQRVLVASSEERNRYYLCQDHTIVNEGSGGALSSNWSYYDFVSGKLQLKESVFTDGNYNSNNPWFYTTSDGYGDHSNPISEEDAENIINKYSHETIPYTFLDDNDDGNAQNDAASDSSSYPTYCVVNCKESITLRPAPDVDSGEICQIPLGSTVSFVANAENGFYEIYYMGNHGYALAAYLEPQ